MAEQRITITIDENGQITAKTEGIKGEICLSELEQLLENEPLLQLDKTDEFHQQAKISSKEQQKINKK